MAVSPFDKGFSNANANAFGLPTSGESMSGRSTRQLPAQRLQNPYEHTRAPALDPLRSGLQPVLGAQSAQGAQFKLEPQALSPQVAGFLRSQAVLQNLLAQQQQQNRRAAEEQLPPAAPARASRAAPPDDAGGAYGVPPPPTVANPYAPGQPVAPPVAPVPTAGAAPAGTPPNPYGPMPNEPQAPSAGQTFTPAPPPPPQPVPPPPPAPAPSMSVPPTPVPVPPAQGPVRPADGAGAVDTDPAGTAFKNKWMQSNPGGSTQQMNAEWEAKKQGKPDNMSMDQWKFQQDSVAAIKKIADAFNEGGDIDKGQVAALNQTFDKQQNEINAMLSEGGYGYGGGGNPALLQAALDKSNALVMQKGKLAEAKANALYQTGQALQQWFAQQGNFEMQKWSQKFQELGLKLKAVNDVYANAAANNKVIGTPEFNEYGKRTLIEAGWDPEDPMLKSMFGGGDKASGPLIGKEKAFDAEFKALIDEYRSVIDAMTSKDSKYWTEQEIALWTEFKAKEAALRKKHGK